MGTHEILEIMYRIQGAADGAHKDETLKERMQEIYEMACDVMRRTGFDPD